MSHKYAMVLCWLQGVDAAKVSGLLTLQNYNNTTKVTIPFPPEDTGNTYHIQYIIIF